MQLAQTYLIEPTQYVERKSKFALALKRSGLFDHASPATGTEGRLQRIRQAMLACLNKLEDCHPLAVLVARVLYAPDAQTLWHLRCDLMTLLACPLGETAAGAHLAAITPLFMGLLPAGLQPRPNRLRH